MLTIKHFSDKDFMLTKWAGGTTRQLYIYPSHSSYQQRDFDYRLSVATVELPTSDFTHLPNYRRILLSLDNPIRLEHQINQTSTNLQPFCPHFFEGSEPIKSYGTCKDFNLMYNNFYQAVVEVHNNDRFTITDDIPIQMLYSLSEARVTVNQSIFKMFPHELLVCDGISKTDKVHFDYLSSQKEKAIWVGLRLKESAE